MASPQINLRVLPRLNERLKACAASSCTAKSEVMVAALASYLGCIENVPLPQKIAELEIQTTIAGSGNPVSAGKQKLSQSLWVREILLF